MDAEPDLQKELQDLAKADRDIAEGERRLTEQIALIRLMTERGESTLEAEKIRRNFEETLEVFRSHRRLIAETLARIEGHRRRRG